MTPDTTGPLTPEERELAQRLARLGTSTGPAPAVDARILAAARGATERPAAPPHRRLRWPVMFGVAASLALAVGIAWQLRPLPDAAVEYSEAPAAAMETTSAIAAGDTATAPGAQAADAAATPEAAQRAHPRPSAPGAASPEPDAFPQPSQRKATVAAPEDAAAPARAPVVAPAAPPPPPPAPVAATEEAGAARDAVQRDSTVSQAVSGNRQDAGGLVPRETSASTVEYGDQSIDDQPPATADAPQVRQAWLQRIRELIAAGETEAARASLEEFRRRHPDAVLPEDLRAFGR